MKISRIRISNFRSIKDMTIDTHSYTSILGSNGAGKSNVLRALNIFFGEVSATEIDTDDWYDRDVSKPIEIELTFDGLSSEEKEDFKHYFRDGKLTFMVEINAQRELKYVGWRMVLADFKGFFRRVDDGAQKDEILELYNDLRNTHTELPKVTGKKAAIDAARAYEEAADSDRKELTKSSQNLYGNTGSGKLKNYVEWVYVPAVQDMSEEGRIKRGNSFAKLIAVLSENETLGRAIADINSDVNEKIKDAISKNEVDLDALSNELSREFKRWSHDNASIKVSREASENPVSIPAPVGKIQEGEFLGEMDSFGHGLHRSYLFTLLITLARKQQSSDDAISESPTIILGIEEPELFQHPHQCRIISDTLRDLSDADNFQTLLTTHSPYLIQPDKLESIIRLSKGDDGTQWCKPELSEIANWSDEIVPHDVFRMLNEGFAEMFFSDFVVFVEGPEDIAYLKAYWRMKGKSKLPHIIPVNGKPNLPKPISLAKALNIDCFVVFDADRKNASNPENEKLAQLLEIDEAETFEKILIEENFAVWPNKIGKTIEAEMSGFNAEAAGKKPLKIAAEVARVVELGETFQSLDNIWSKIEAKM